MFNPAVSRLTAPPVSVVQDWRASYGGSRGPLIDMSQAVPGYPAHPDMTKALQAAASDQDAARYGRVEGDWDLRVAYAAHLGSIYGADVEPAEIHITSGCNQAYIASIICVANEGDEIMISNPGYFSHELSLRMLNIKPKYLH